MRLEEFEDLELSCGERILMTYMDGEEVQGNYSGFDMFRGKLAYCRELLESSNLDKRPGELGIKSIPLIYLVQIERLDES